MKNAVIEHRLRAMSTHHANKRGRQFAAGVRVSHHFVSCHRARELVPRGVDIQVVGRRVGGPR